MPRPPGRLLSGNLPDLQHDGLAFFSRCAAEYGDVVRARFWTVSGVQLTHPNDVHELFVRHNDALEKPIDLKLLRLLVGRGLLTTDGETWRRQRRMVQPTFSADRIHNIGSVALRRTAERIDHWTSGDCLDVSAEMAHISLQVASQAFMGTDLDDDAVAVGAALDSFMNEFERMWTTSMLPLPTLDTWRAFVRRRQLDRLIYRIINTRRQGPKGDDLLGRLLEVEDAGQKLTNREVRDQVVTLLLAGHETTALTVSYALLLLAENPDEADLLYDAVGDGPLTVDDGPRLDAARHVVLEAMRLYPPAWGVGRATKAPIEIAGYDVPRGVQIYVLPWVTHRDERFFDDPEAFRPERWRNDVNKKAYFPFGGGPRKCIGAHLAMMEATLMVAAIARDFRFKVAPSHRLELQPSVTLRPRNGIRLEAERRPKRIRLAG